VPGCPTLFQHLDEALAGKPEMGPSAKMCPRHCLWNAGFDLVKAHRPRTMLNDISSDRDDDSPLRRRAADASLETGSRESVLSSYQGI
jgi:hypothetical protein